MPPISINSHQSTDQINLSILPDSRHSFVTVSGGSLHQFPFPHPEVPHINYWSMVSAIIHHFPFPSESIAQNSTQSLMRLCTPVNNEGSVLSTWKGHLTIQVRLSDLHSGMFIQVTEFSDSFKQSKSNLNTNLVLVNIVVQQLLCKQ